MTLATTQHHVYATQADVTSSNDERVNQSGFTNYSTGCPCPLGVAGKISITTIISFLLIIGLVGNTLTMTVIIKNKSLRTNFNRFLISLCASDLVSACICSPLWAYGRTWGFDEWLWGQSTCKLFCLSDLITNFVTALHILSFCILRFIALSKPLKAPTSIFSVQHFRVYIAFLWLSSLLICMPYGYMTKVKVDDLDGDPWPSCSIGLEYKEEYHIYSIVVYSIFFYLPAIIIFILSVASTKNLSKMIERSALSRISDPLQAERIKRRNKMARFQMQLICACFFMGYIPSTSYHLWASSGDEWTCDTYATDYWVGVSTYVLLRVSECLNPVMYNLGCKEMRMATVKLIKEDILRMTASKTNPNTNFSPDIVSCSSRKFSHVSDKEQL